MDYWEEKAVRLQGDGYILSKRRTSILPTALPGRKLFSPAVRVASNLITPESRSFLLFLQLIIEKYGISRHWQTAFPSLFLLFKPPPDSAAIQVYTQWQFSLLTTAGTRSIFRNIIRHHELGHHEFERRRYNHLDTPDLKRIFQTTPEIYNRYLTQVESTVLKAIPFIVTRCNISNNIHRYSINGLETSPTYSTAQHIFNGGSHAINWPELFFTPFLGGRLGSSGDSLGSLGDRQENREYGRILYNNANGTAYGAALNTEDRNATEGIIRQIRSIFFDSKLLTAVLRTYGNRSQSFLSKLLTQTKSMGILSTDNNDNNLVEQYDDRYENQHTYLHDHRYEQEHRYDPTYENEPEAKILQDLKKGNGQPRSVSVTKSRLNMLKPVSAGQIQHNIRTVNPGSLFILNGPVDYKQVGKEVYNNSGLQYLTIKPLTSTYFEPHPPLQKSSLIRQESDYRFNSSQLSDTIYHLRTFPSFTTDSAPPSKQSSFVGLTWLSDTNSLFLQTIKDTAIIRETEPAGKDYTYPGMSAEKAGGNIPDYLKTKQQEMLSHKQYLPAREDLPIPAAPDSSREPGNAHRKEQGHHPSDILLEQIRVRTKSPGMLINQSTRKIATHWKKDVFQSAAGTVEMTLVKSITPLDGDIEKNNRHLQEKSREGDVLERTVHHRWPEQIGKNSPAGETVHIAERERIRNNISRNPLTYLDPRKADIGILKGSGMEKTGDHGGVLSEHSGESNQTFSNRDTGTIQNSGASANGQGAINYGPGSPKYQVPQDGRQPLQEIEKLIDMNRLADRLYRMLERKIRDERERRGR